MAGSTTANHVGFITDPARVRSPKDKPRVERTVQYVRGNFWAGERFTSLTQAQEAVVRWCSNTAGLRIHGTTCARPLEVFDDSELSVLLPMPPEYDVPIFKVVKVHRDFHAEVARALYSLPQQWIGSTLSVRADTELVKFYHRGTLVKIHPRQPPGGRSTDRADLPEHKTDYALRDVTSLIAKCTSHGPNVGIYAERILDDPLPWTRIRSVYRLQGLVRRYGAERVEQACSLSLDLDVVSVTKIASTLERATESTSPDLPKAVGQSSTRFDTRSNRIPFYCNHISVRRRRQHRIFGGKPMSTTRAAGTTEPVGTDLVRLLKALKLGALADTLPERAALARQHKLSHIGFLEVLLADEVNRRNSRSATLRATKAGLDPTMAFDSWNALDDLSYDRTLLGDLTSLRFLDAHQSAIILGPVGVGKTHLATALGHMAIRRRHSVLFARSDKLFTKLRAARLDNTVDAEIRRLTAIEVLIIDDFALRPLDATETSDFYELIVERHRKKTTIVTSRNDQDLWIWEGVPSRKYDPGSHLIKSALQRWRKGTPRAHGSQHQ